MKKALKDLVGSKKFLVMMATIIVAVAGRAGLDLDVVSVMAILVPGVGFVLGQGLADNGKEKAKATVEASAKNPPEVLF